MVLNNRKVKFVLGLLLYCLIAAVIALIMYSLQVYLECLDFAGR